MTTVTITAGNLRRALRAAALFADNDEYGVPDLAAIHIEAGSGVLTATATDRYVLGHARTDADGALDVHGAGIQVRHAQMVIDMLDDIPGLAAVELTAPLGGPLRVKGVNVAVEVPTCYIPGTSKYRELFQKLDDAYPAGTSQMLIAPSLLKAIAGLEDIYPTSAGRWTFTDPLKPVRVEVGAHFVALLMPVKQNDQVAAAQWPVPVGIPDPAAIPA